MSLITKLWRGEISLPRMYWLFGAFGTIFLHISLIILVGIYPGRVTVICTILVWVYEFIVLVGIWRSATKYYAHFLNQASKKRFWAVLAKTATVLAFIVFITTLSQFFHDIPLMPIAVYTWLF